MRARVPSYESSIEVDADVSVPLVQVLARQAAAAVGASARDRAEFVTAATEAATNIVRHAVQGVIVVRAFPGPPDELEFEATDDGPGIRDPEAAMIDGFSRGPLTVDERQARSLGCGFGAIRRLMDEVRVESTPRGTRVVAHKRLGGIR